MKRREFIAASAALLVLPWRSWAQGTRRRLGVFGFGLVPTLHKALLDGLRNHGWIDGRNLIIDYRYPQSQDLLPTLAAELIALSPDLLIASNPQTALALKSATASVPIVFVGVADPVRLGLVQSLSRPGGNITALATFVPGNFTGKEIETLREIVPTASKISILVNPGNPTHRLIVAEELPQIARNLGVTLPIVEACTAEELDIAFASAAAQHADAIVPFGDPLTVINAARVTALAAEHRLPASYLFRLFVTKGGLISYGPDIADLFFRAGGYVDKILKGTKPSDLPVEQPTKFQLVINMRTANTLGLTVPPLVLARADEVIE